MTLITKAPREGASFITSQSELGVIWGGGVGQNSWVFSAIPHLELGKTPLPKGLVLGQISVFLGKWLFRRPKEKQASSDAADAGLGVSADAADAGRIVATLSGRVGCDAADAGRIVATFCVRLYHSCSRHAATCLFVYVWRKVSMLGQNLLDLSRSLSGKVFTCWNKTRLVDMLCWIKTAPARLVLCNFRSTTMQACSCSFVTMAASVRHNLKLGISEFCCVASPAPARAFVPAPGSQVGGKF